MDPTKIWKVDRKISPPSYNSKAHVVSSTYIYLGGKKLISM